MDDKNYVQADFLLNDVPKKEVVRRTPAWMRTDRGLPYKDLFESRAGTVVNPVKTVMSRALI